MVNEHISRAICVALVARGIPQKQCCKDVRVHRATFSNYVNNRLDWCSDPGGELLSRIASYLDLTINHFFPPLTTEQSLQLVSGLDS